ncbi:hypothetical protein C8R47DRAFT_1215286 [Mycena vitilis]|nr:hypothetical protein C8R47DRAFT_1215286 [Mycena vitilis]
MVDSSWAGGRQAGSGGLAVRSGSRLLRDWAARLGMKVTIAPCSGGVGTLAAGRDPKPAPLHGRGVWLEGGGFPATESPNGWPYLQLNPDFARALHRVNKYRFYVIYGRTTGGIEHAWGYHPYTCAWEVWNGLTEELELQRKGLAALRILGYAFEAQGDATAVLRFHGFS